MIQPLMRTLVNDKLIASLLISAGALLLMTLARPGFTQHVIDNSYRTGKKNPYANLPPQFRDALLSQDLEKEEPSGELTDVVGTPWNGPTGERLVGVVEDRMMTQPQLAMRVNLMLKGMPPIDDPFKSQDRRVLLESRILADWKESTTLAVHAKNEGYTVNQQEIDQTMADLATRSDGAPQKSQEVMRMIGIPEDLLRTEIRDGILIEKLIRDKMGQFFSEQTMRDLFKTDPSVFLEPTKVKAWHVFYPQMGRLTPRQKDELEKTLKGFAKKLNKCKNPEDYQELSEAIGQVDTLMLSDMDWVYEDENIPMEVRRSLFTLNPGKTSGIIRSPMGFHIVKVIDRQDGDQGTFEEARPQIENYLFEKTKILIYETAKKNYKIYTNSGGLNIWKKVPKGAVRRPDSSQTATSNPTEGPADSALGDVPPMLPTGDGDVADVPPVESLIGRE